MEECEPGYRSPTACASRLASGCRRSGRPGWSSRRCRTARTTSPRRMPRSTSGSREGGFAVCRLDIRGTGSSEGIADDEYTRRSNEISRGDRLARDARLVERPRRHVRHLVVGLQLPAVACERPPALRRSARSTRPTTATPTTSTTWAARSGRSTSSTTCLYMVAMNVLPPVPARLRRRLARRVGCGASTGTEPWLLRWLEEQHDGPYWRHGRSRDAGGTGRATTASRARR